MQNRETDRILSKFIAAIQNLIMSNETRETDHNSFTFPLLKPLYTNSGRLHQLQVQLEADLKTI